METKRFIDTLLKKYQLAPDFPFLNWSTDSVSFYALMNLWDDLFKAAAGKLVEEFQATMDVKMDPDSPIYDVTAPTLSKRLIVGPQPEGGTFHFIPRDHEPSAPFRSELEFATDIAPMRLVAAFEIIRAYLAHDGQDRGALETLDSACVEQYKERFGFPDYDPFSC